MRKMAIVLLLCLVILSQESLPYSFAEEVVKTMDIEILPLEEEYDEIENFSEGLALVRKGGYVGGLHGFIDSSGKVVIPVEYNRAHPFYDGYARVKKGGKTRGKWGIIDRTGKVVVPLIYDEIGDFEEGLAFVKKGKKYGFVDKQAKIRIPIEYDFVQQFSEGLAVAIKDGQKYLINKKNDVLAELDYDSIEPFSEGLAAVSIGMKNGYINTSGELVIPLVYENVTVFYNGLGFVKQDHKYNLIDKEGNTFFPYWYDSISRIGDSLIMATRDGKSYVYDKNGNEIKIFNFDNAFLTDQGRILGIETDRGSGYLSFDGKPITALKYTDITLFYDGLAWVSIDDKKGCINTKGELVIPIEYENRILELGYNHFRDGLCVAKKAGKTYLIRNKKYIASKTPTKEEEYIYGELDNGESLVLPGEELEQVEDKATATEAVNKAIAGATEEQKTSATGTDLLTLYGEEAALRTAKTEVEGSEFIIDKASVEKVENAAIEAKTAVEGALKDGGVTVQRELSTGVIYEVKEGDKLSVKVDASSAEAKVGNVRVETPTYALSFNKKALASIKEESAEPLEITVTELPAENAALPRLMGTQLSSKAVGANLLEDAASKIFHIKFSKKIKEKIKLSLPVIKGNPNYQAVYDSTGKAIGGKYNPVTKKLDVKINKSDKYVVKEKKSFADITSKSKEMQDAIEILASKGIIAGTSPTNFSPEGTMTRGDVAVILHRLFKKLW